MARPLVNQSAALAGASWWHAHSVKVHGTELGRTINWVGHNTFICMNLTLTQICQIWNFKLTTLFDEWPCHIMYCIYLHNFSMKRRLCFWSFENVMERKSHVQIHMSENIKSVHFYAWLRFITGFYTVSMYHIYSVSREDSRTYCFCQTLN